MKDSTVKTKTQRIKLCAKHGANILDPESVKETIDKAEWMDSTKRETVRDFSSLYYFLQIEWDKPTYRAQDKMPFIPTEEELDTLISASGRLHAPLLQFLKESGARIGEASQIEWIDVDLERKIVAVDHPEKGSKARLCPISEKLRTMLGQLPRPNNLLFRLKKESLRKIFEAMRNRTATKMANPRLQRITFHTFRHWKGTTEYHKTKDILHVASILGHKDIKSTMKYIAIENALYSNTFDDEWTHKVCHSIEEEGKLINAGFELVRAVNETTTIYRKRK
jgi:integrase